MGKKEDVEFIHDLCLPILSAFCTTALGMEYYHYSHFTEEETEAQRAWVTCLKSPRQDNRNWKPPFRVLFPLALPLPTLC